MSAPDTDIEKQEKRHKPALTGISVAVGFAGVLLLGFIIWLVAAGNEPEGAETQIDGRTGVAVAPED